MLANHVQFFLCVAIFLLHSDLCKQIFDFATFPSQSASGFAAMAIDARFTQDIIKQVDKVLAMKKAGSLTKWNAVQAIFDAQSLLQKHQVRNGQVMVHQKNRSNLGLNPHNVHKNLSVIKQVGADRQHLKKATAFEINPHGDKYHAQVKFNQDLVNSTDGLLAPLTG